MGLRRAERGGLGARPREADMSPGYENMEGSFLVVGVTHMFTTALSGGQGRALR